MAVVVVEEKTAPCVSGDEWVEALAVEEVKVTFAFSVEFGIAMVSIGGSIGGIEWILVSGKRTEI